MATRIALTIGTATYDDYTGLYMTIQAMRLFHREALKSAPCELIVVDNHPESADAKDAANLIKNWVRDDFAQARYVPFTGVVGTSAPRDLIFRESQADAVLVLDSHVMLAPGAIGRLLRYFQEHPDCNNMLHGPMLYDDLKNFSTHFDDQWRAEMWGTWGTDPRGENPDGEPFEIPGCGLGLFACRREAWPGFPPGLQGFGGEEMSIHAMFKQLGRTTLCLPFLRWLHRFGRPAGPPYPVTRRNKIRNYLIWAKALGMAPDRVRDHFVGEIKVSAQEFDAIYQEVQGTTMTQSQPDKPGCNSCAERAKQRQREQQAAQQGPQLWQVTPETTLDDLFKRAGSEPSLMVAHVAKLRDLASQSEVVLELDRQQGVSTVALLAGQPKQLISVGPDGPLVKVLQDRTGATQLTPVAQTPDPENLLCDLLVVDGEQTADGLWRVLQELGPKALRWIAIHNTVAFGELSRGGRSPGVLHALRRWLRENKEWSVLYHSQASGGLTVLTQEPAEKKELPGGWKMLGNLMTAVGQHLATGMHAAEPELLDSRLDVCATCDQRTDSRCAVCGCFVEVKASWQTQDCPLAKWPADGVGLTWEPPQPLTPLPEWPKVVALCPSYRRAKLLANTIAMFQLQDYPAEHRQLLILEDSGVMESQSGEGWQVISEPDRYPSLSAKYQRLLELAQDADIVVVMEDDDLYLPWYISSHVAALRNAQWSKPGKIWSLYNTQTPFQEAADGRFHGSIAARRNFLASVGGWAEVTKANFDQVLLGKLAWAATPADPMSLNASPAYVFRWASTGVPHSQGFMKGPEDTTWWDEYAKSLAAQPADAPRVLTPAFDGETQQVFRSFFALSPSLTQA